MFEECWIARCIGQFTRRRTVEGGKAQNSFRSGWIRSCQCQERRLDDCTEQCSTEVRPASIFAGRVQLEDPVLVAFFAASDREKLRVIHLDRGSSSSSRCKHTERLRPRYGTDPWSHVRPFMETDTYAQSID